MAHRINPVIPAPYGDWLAEACDAFGLGSARNARPLRGGTANASFVLDDEQPVIVTFCLSHTPQRAEQLARLLEHLECHGLATNRIQRTTKGHVLHVVAGVPVLVKEFVAGRPLTGMDPVQARRLGAVLARIHQVPAPADLVSEHSMAPAVMAKIGSRAGDSEFSCWLTEALDGTSKDWNGLTSGLVHGDLFPDNLIETDAGELIPIDFEEACLYPLVFDVGMALVGLANIQALTPMIARQVVLGYQAASALPQAELEFLPTMFDISAAMTACWRYDISHREGPEASERRDWRDMQGIRRLSLEWRAGGTWAQITQC